MAAAETTGRAMASEVRIVTVDAPADAGRRAMARIEDLERRWTRFAPTSDISRLNRAAGEEVRVGRDTITLVAAMVEGWRATAGRYDPGVLPDLVVAGYDASIVDGRRAPALPSTARSGADLTEIVLDPTASTVRLPPGAALDPGGIGKGLAADLVVGELLARGAAGALVGIGGDLVVAGAPPGGDLWSVDVEDPSAPGVVLRTLHLDHGGVATSSTTSRRWVRHGDDRHHVVDPRTGEPARTDLASVTVVAPTGWQAEVMATAALLAGATGATSYLDGQGLDGLAVSLSGALLATPALAHPIRRSA